MLTYCEVCGILVREGSGTELPEGVICDGCYHSRRVVVVDEEPPADDDESERTQFECVYCRKLLRVRCVAHKTRVKCPACAESFFLLADGTRQSLLEGGDTAILPQRDFMPQVTPAQGVESERRGAPRRDEGDKTQPLRKLTPAAPQDQPGSKRHEPSTPTFAGKARKAAALEAPPALASSDHGLDLLPEAIGPGEASARTLDLRASDEGRLDLAPDDLKQKTRKLKRPTTRSAPRPEAPRRLSEEERATRHSDEEAQREEQARRALEAARKGAALARSEQRRTLGRIALMLVVLTPLLAAAVLLSMTTRGVGFASRGPTGAFLEDLGAGADRGLRALNGLLPAGVRSPVIPAERPAASSRGEGEARTDGAARTD